MTRSLPNSLMVVPARSDRTARGCDGVAGRLAWCWPAALSLSRGGRR